MPRLPVRSSFTRNAPLGLALLVILGAAVVVVFRLSDRADHETAVLDLGEVYRRLGASLRADASEVVVLDVEAIREGAPPVRWTIWADPTSEGARREFVEGAGAQSPVTIADSDAAHTLGANASFTIDERVCPEADAAVALITDCPNQPFETYVFDADGNPRATTAVPEVTVLRTEVDGRAVVEVVTTKYQQPFRANPFTETRRLLLDADTYLPIRLEVTQDPGVTEVFHYESEVVPLDSLASGFFEPLSLPALRPDPEAALTEGVASDSAYWLGADFERNEVPALTLWRSSGYQADPGDPTTAQVMLEYVRTSDVFGQHVVVRPHGVFEGGVGAAGRADASADRSLLDGADDHAP